MNKSSDKVLNSLTNHFGTSCPYKLLLCQEGFCTNCQIFLDYRNSDAKVDKFDKNHYNYK